MVQKRADPRLSSPKGQETSRQTYEPPPQVRSGASPNQTLSARDREVLRDIIHTYVATGEPVSSRLLSKHAQHRVSSATIRNVMADLEDLELLRQPHTSAGRVPTEKAYRLYIENLMRMRRVSARERRYIDDQLDIAAAADELVSIASHLLSELSSQVGVVLTPAAPDIVLRSADFVPLGGHRVLCVLVSQSGFVDNVVVETETEIERADLVRFSNFFTEQYAGRTLREVRDHLLRTMAEERQQLDAWLRQAMAFAQQALADQVRDVLVEGASTLLGRPELSDLERVRRMLDTFADKARLANVLSLCLEAGDGVRVYLGEDSEVTSELEFSVVATPYGVEGTALGSLGVIGPSRMEYPRVVPLVRYLGETLTRALAREEGAARDDPNSSTLTSTRS